MNACFILSWGPSWPLENWYRRRNTGTHMHRYGLVWPYQGNSTRYVFVVCALFAYVEKMR